MTPTAFAAELGRLNAALNAGDDTEAQAAIYAMEWVVPGTAERMVRSLLATIPAFSLATPATRDH